MRDFKHASKHIYISSNVCADIYHHELTTRRNFISVTKKTKNKKQKTKTNKNIFQPF